MRGSKAKQLRRNVRMAINMPILRVDGKDLNKIGCEHYQVNTYDGQVRMAPHQSRAVYQQYKRLVKAGEYGEY